MAGLALPTSCRRQPPEGVGVKVRVRVRCGVGLVWADVQAWKWPHTPFCAGLHTGGAARRDVAIYRYEQLILHAHLKTCTHVRVYQDCSWATIKRDKKKKKEKKGRLSVCAHMRFKYEGKFSDRNSQNWAEHRRKTLFLVITCLMYGIVFLAIFLDGWRIGQWN